jgi:hypothetical protein
VEQTGTLENISTLVEEGTVTDPDPAPDPEFSTSTPIGKTNSTLEGPTDHAQLQKGNPDNSADTDCEEDQSTSSSDSQLVPLESPPPEEPQPTPQIVDAGPTRRSTRTRRLPAKLQDFHLANVCLSEAYSTLDSSSSDGLSWEPAPRSIRDRVKMPHGAVKDAWLKSVRAELKTLVVAKIFMHDTLQQGETSTPVMEIFKIKIKSWNLGQAQDQVGC